MIVPLVRRLVGEGQKVIIFRNAKGPAEGCAEYLSRELGLPAATSLIQELPTHDPTGSSIRLVRCLNGGTAFHNANLRRDERLAVERAFRDPEGAVRVLAATTTVAAGINTPASTVILAEQEFYGEDGRLFTVAEYKNMAGRAGRLGFNESGTSVILADDEHPRGVLFGRYVSATPDGMRSSFVESDVSTWVLRLLTQVRTIARAQVPAMLARTYAGYLFAKRDPQWNARTSVQVEELLRRMLELGLLDEELGNVRLSLLGQACGRSALSFESAMRLVQLLRTAGTRSITVEALMALVQALPEADGLSTPIVRGRKGEPDWIGRATSLFGGSIIGQLQAQAEDMRAYQKRCKRACLLHEWINGTPIRAIEEGFSKNAFAEVSYGTVVGIAEGTRFWLGSAADILPLVLVGHAPDSEALEVLLRRLESGLPSELFGLLGIPVQLTRGECLTLRDAGITKQGQFWETPRSRLDEMLTKSRVDRAFAMRK
jgi:replicative superfamily II helicase